MKSKKKLITLLVSFLVIAIFAVGGTVAFLYTKDGPKINTFAPSKVTTEVVEDIKTDSKTKKDVKIQNTGNTDAWIRAYVVITWQDVNGNVYGQMPEEGDDKDYTIEWNYNVEISKDGNWIQGKDGFYYYTLPVAPGAVTENELIKSISVNEKSAAPASDYYLNVEIIGSGLQSVPDTVFNTVWASSGLEVSKDGKTLVNKGTGGTQ